MSFHFRLKGIQLSIIHSSHNIGGIESKNVYFLSFLPQFILPKKGPAIVQFLLLGLVFFFVNMSFLYTSMIAISFRPIGRMMKQTVLGHWSEKFEGLIYYLR